MVKRKNSVVFICLFEINSLSLSIRKRDMRVVHEFKCSLTGEECIVIADERGDAMCLSKVDYEIMNSKKVEKRFEKNYTNVLDTSR